MEERFCSLNQRHSECQSTSVEIMAFRLQNRVKTKKKGLHRKYKSLCPRDRVRPKKKKGLHRNLELNSAGIRGIYLC